MNSTNLGPLLANDSLPAAVNSTTSAYTSGIRHSGSSVTAACPVLMVPLWPHAQDSRTQRQSWRAFLSPINLADGDRLSGQMILMST